MLLILYALTQMTGFGFTSTNLLVFGAGVLTIVGFVAWERRSATPLLEPSILRERVLVSSMLAAFFQSLAGFAVLFLVIMYLQGPRAMTPFDASLLLVPGYVLGGFVAPFAGRLSDKLGARVVASLGLLVQAAGFFTYSTLGIDAPLSTVVLGSILTGAGNSSFFPANNSAVMSAAPPRAYRIASGLLRTLSNIGMVCSFAVALLIASLSIPRQMAFEIFLGLGGIPVKLSTAFIDGMHSALIGSVSLLAAALLLSILRGRERKTIQNQSRDQDN